ncbi:hypothetical protein NL676_024926 [Syzygium grande]|nr:hypothetical protein NL676_024926 [Syzygium grande]
MTSGLQRLELSKGFSDGIRSDKLLKTLNSIMGKRFDPVRRKHGDCRGANVRGKAGQTGGEVFSISDLLRGRFALEQFAALSLTPIAPKDSWPELVGQNANSVKAIIEKDNPQVTVVPLPA